MNGRVGYKFNIGQRVMITSGHDGTGIVAPGNWYPGVVKNRWFHQFDEVWCDRWYAVLSTDGRYWTCMEAGLRRPLPGEEW
jgi:hypothetical protein